MINQANEGDLKNSECPRYCPSQGNSIEISPIHNFGAHRL